MMALQVLNGVTRKRSDGRWEYCFKDDQGKRRYINAYTRSELQEKIAEAFSTDEDPTLSSVAVPPPHEEEIKVPEAIITVEEWLHLWFDNYVTAGKSTRQRYEIDIRLHIVPAIGSMAIADLTSLDLQQLFKAMLEKGLSPKSVKNAHGMLHASFATAVKLGYMARNVSEDCSLPKVQKKEMRTLADANLASFLNVAEGDEFYPAFYVCLFTGMRESELLGLTWDCVNFKKNTIRIYRQFRRQNFHNEPSVWKFSPLKNRKERTIKAPCQVMEMLKQIQEKQKERRRACGLSWKNRENFIFTKKNGEFIQTSQLYRHFKRLVAEMGEPDVRFHDLRHTYATLAIQSGTDLKTVSANLGHATVAFTMDQYAHVSEAMKEKSANLMENLIAALPNK